MTRTDLTALRVPGLGTVEAVRVTTGQDSEDRPTHVFSLLIERNRDPQPPTIRVLDRADWHRHEGA